MNGNLIGLQSHNSDKNCWAIFDRHYYGDRRVIIVIIRTKLWNIYVFPSYGRALQKVSYGIALKKKYLFCKIYQLGSHISRGKPKISQHIFLSLFLKCQTLTWSLQMQCSTYLASIAKVRITPIEEVITIKSRLLPILALEPAWLRFELEKV